MRVLTFSPSRELAPFVRGFSVVETDGEPATRMLLPDTGVVLGIRYRGFARQIDEHATGRLPDATLAGMRRSARHMYTSANAGIVLATFHPSGAQAFFAEPLHELFSKTTALDQILPASEIERTASRVADASDHGERIALVERLLTERLQPNQRDPMVVLAVRAFKEAHGAVRIGELARALDISCDRFEKRFRHAVGASPKQFATILRLRRAIELHRSGASMAEAALDASYFDQSHFIREFRLFTGEAPGRFFRGVEHC